MDGFSIRAASVADVEILVRHRVGMFRDMGTDPVVVAALEEPSRTYFAKAVAEGTYRAWLAQTPDGRVVAGGGIILLPWPSAPRDPYPRKAMILNMYTEPEYRRQGLARKLMVEMLDWCREEGFKTVSLHASDEGRPLYEALGFKPTNEMRLTL
jgi:GNAT superfamily N-acetyltransferase